MSKLPSFDAHALLIIFFFFFTSIAQSSPGLGMLSRRWTTLSQLGCIPEGMNISYQCTVNDTSEPPIGSTVWRGSAFFCPDTLNQISLPHSQFNKFVTSSCGGLRAVAVGLDRGSYVSQLSLMAVTGLNGSTLSCSLSGMFQIGSDILKIGSKLPPHLRYYLHAWFICFLNTKQLSCLS